MENNIFTLKNSLLIVIISSLFLVSGSFFIDKVLGEKPCDLCLITRYSHLFIAIFAIFSLVSKKLGNSKILGALIFLVLCFGFYHVGVENHWWNGPAHCTTDLLPTVENSNVSENKVRCDEVNFSIFGVSLAVYNFVILSGVFWLVSIAVALESTKKRMEKNV